MKYDLLRTDRFNDQLQDLILYIAKTNCRNVAFKQLELIEHSVLNLRDFPYIGKVPRYQIIKNQGFRVLIIPGYLIFYKVFENKNQIIFYSIFSDKQNYINLI